MRKGEAGLVVISSVSTPRQLYVHCVNTAKALQSISEKPHFSQKTREMGHPALHKPQRVGHRTAGTDSCILRPAKDAGLRMTKQYSKSGSVPGLEWASCLNERSSFYSRSYS